MATINVGAPAGVRLYMDRDGGQYVVSGGVIALPSQYLTDALRAGWTLPDSELQAITTPAKVNPSAESQTVKVIGVLKGADMNVTTDQAITIAGLNGGAYALDAIHVTNASVSLDTAAGGVYTAASKGGTAVVANTQVYTACASATGLAKLTLAAAGTASVFTAATLYLSLTTAQGAPATADVYVWGRPLA